MAELIETRPGGGQARAAVTLGCRLTVPAYNESERILRCLESLSGALLPEGCAWKGWAVLDGASTDGTAEGVRAWSAEPGRPSVSVLTSARREGKAAALGTFHRWALGAPPGEADVVVVVDADTVVLPHTLAALLSPFIKDPALAVVWGLDRPDDTSWGRWASAFQMELVSAMAVALPPGEPRAYGRLFAYRPGLLGGFTWDARAGVDDLQLAAFVRGSHLKVMTAREATVMATPAAGWRDFYLQTYRYYWARGSRYPGDAADAESRRSLAKATAGLATARRHPLWAGSYVLAQVVALWQSRTSPAPMTGAWQASVSTKRAAPSPGETGEAPARGRGLRVPTGRWGSLRGKYDLALCCRRRLENWPWVLARVAAHRLGWYRGSFRVRTRDGVRLQAPDAPGVWDPMVEVLVKDAYRLGEVSFEDAGRDRVVLDVGAHVGSFTCAMAGRLSGARFVCVEPSPGAQSWLRSNLEINGLPGRAVVIPVAVACSDGDVTLWSHQEASCEASLVEGLVQGERHPLVVQGMSFGSIVAAAGGRVDIVKLDCEGGEYEAVLHSEPEAWSAVGEVFLEYHPVPGRHFAELEARLGEMGFVLAWREQGPRDPELGMARFSRSRERASRS